MIPKNPRQTATGYPSAFLSKAFLGLLLGLGWVAGCSRSTNVESTVASADRLFEKRDFEAAKIQYVNVLRAQQTNAHAIMRLGRIFFEQGQLQSAFPLLHHVRDQYPKEIPVREALALIYSVAGTNLWKAEVDALLELDPANETAIMTLLRTSTTEADRARLTNTLASLRSRAGDRAVFTLADGELALRRGDKEGALAAYRRAVTVEPTSVLAHLTLGGFLMGDGKTDEGLSLFAKAAELSPQHGIARLRYAQALLQAQRIDDAIQVLDEINAKAPEMIPAWTTRAEVAFSRKLYPDARRILARALTQSPGDPKSLRLRAKIDLAENKPADAVQALDLAAKWSAASGEFQYQLAIANLLNKDLNRAVNHLREAVRLEPNGVEPALLLSELEIARGNSSEAIGTLLGVIQRAPQIGQAKMLLARAYRATGRLDEAITTYAAAAQQFPTNSAPSVQLGLVLIQKERFPEARQAFERSLQIEPLNRMAFEQLVQLDVRAGDRTAASARVEKRIADAPNDTLPWLVKSELLRTSGDTSGSESALRRVLELEPDSQRALVALAQLYITTGRNAEALAELARAVEKAPDNVGALTMIGMLHSENGKVAEARAAYESALKHKPDAWLVLNNLAFLLAERLGEVPGAHELATRARRINPRSPVVADTLGWIEYRRGNYSEALRLLLDAAEEMGGNAEIQYHLGMAHYMMGHEAPARIALRQAVDAPGKFDARDSAKSYLAILEMPTDPATPEVITALEKRRVDDPKDLVALSRLAAAYAASGATEKSREAFESAIKVNPSSAGLLGRFALLQVQQLGNTNRALELARQARQFAPEDPNVAFDAGRAAFAAKDHAYGYSLLQDSASRLPTNQVVQFELGLAAYAVGRVEQATNVMTGVAKDGPPALAGRAKSFLDLVAFSSGPTPPRVPPEVEKALAAEPRTLAGRFASARLVDTRQQPDQAREAYEKLVADFPSFLPASRRLALLLAETDGQAGKAYDMTLRLRQDLPRDDEIAASLGKLALRRGDFRFSVQLLTEATRTRRQDGDALYHLGLAYLGLKQNPEGKAALEQALAISPEGKFVPEAKKLLGTLSTNAP